MGHDRVPLRQGEVTLGRSRYCSLVVDDPAVSRQHAAIRVRGEEMVLYDLGSRNGTTLNGERIAAPASLKLGDVLTLGACSIQLIESRMSDDAARTAEAMPAPEPRPLAETQPDD
jgi:pSer/pThr/pTyr-binding forkhead associated (FHA) protein